MRPDRRIELREFNWDRLSIRELHIHIRLAPLFSNDNSFHSRSARLSTFHHNVTTRRIDNDCFMIRAYSAGESAALAFPIVASCLGEKQRSRRKPLCIRGLLINAGDGKLFRTLSAGTPVTGARRFSEKTNRTENTLRRAKNRG